MGWAKPRGGPEKFMSILQLLPYSMYKRGCQSERIQLFLDSYLQRGKKLPLHVKVTAPPHVMKVGQHLTRPFDNSSLFAWFPSNLYLLSSKLYSYISEISVGVGEWNILDQTKYISHATTIDLIWTRHLLPSLYCPPQKLRLAIYLITNKNFP